MTVFDQTVDDLVASSGSGFARLEVIAGPTGRRRRPSPVKARIVAESYASAETVSAVAKRHGLRPQQLFDWRRDARAGRLALPAEVAPHLVDEGSVSRVGCDRGAEAVSAVEIETGGVTVRLAGRPAADRIARVAAALRRAL